jgi:two-component system chemotaxis response regulator CheY
MKALIVDDSKAVHAFVREILNEIGVEHQSVFNGREGLSKLQEVGEGYFSIVFLDWEMPEMTGPELVKELNRIGFKVPIIMMTSKSSMSDIAQMLSEGVAEYIMKPFTQDIFKGKLEEVVGKGQMPK